MEAKLFAILAEEGIPASDDGGWVRVVEAARLRYQPKAIAAIGGQALELALGDDELLMGR